MDRRPLDVGPHLLFAKYQFDDRLPHVDVVDLRDQSWLVAIIRSDTISRYDRSCGLYVDHNVYVTGIKRESLIFSRYIRFSRIL